MPFRQTFAIVPACGHSTRMGRPKLALPFRGHTVIECVVSALRDGGVEQVVVITGPHVPELVTPARAAGAAVLELSDPTPDMRATVEAGLAWLQERYQPTAEDWWILAPGDHPVLAADVVRELLTAAAESDDRDVIVPVHAGRRGHPALLRWRLVDAIRSMQIDRGINSLLRELTSRTRELSVNDASILVDLDTPEDYERLNGEADPRISAHP